MKKLADLDFEEIAFEVCTAFEGGGAATIYAPKAYQTRDFDFVLHVELFGMPSDAPLRELGFAPSNAKGTYEHPEIPFTLEVLQGPLGVGEETLTSWETRHKDDRILHIISPLDSVKDRLASAIHFRDLNSARQAAEIAKLHKINLQAVKTWCEAEGGITTYELFEAFLYQ